MKIFHNIYYIVKELIRSSIILNKCYLFFFKKNRIINSETIAVVGFPRVGNTFAGRVIKVGFGSRKFKIVNHYHSSAQAISASSLKIPTILIIRKPVDTILSLYISYPLNSYYISTHIIRFIIYHLRILFSNSKLLIINFDDFKDNPNFLLKKVNQEFQFNLDQNILNEELKKNVLNSIKIDNKLNPNNKLKVSAPSKEKEILKEKYRQSINSNCLLIIANYLHTKLLNKTNA